MVPTWDYIIVLNERSTTELMKLDWRCFERFGTQNRAFNDYNVQIIYPPRAAIFFPRQTTPTRPIL